jgi:hypothetical protein
LIVNLRRLSVLALLLWLPAETIRISPSYLAYFNQLVGGPANGYKYLSGPDLDWGQDLKHLATYLRRRGIARIKLAYFGPDDPRMYGISYELLRPGEPATGDIAVSATLLNSCGEAFAWLRRYEPVATIGYSIFVYRIGAGAPLPPFVSDSGCAKPHPLFRFI